MKTPFLSLNSAEVIKLYPKTIKKLKQWFINTNLEALPDDVSKEEAQIQLEEAINDEYINMVLTYSSRVLYDFFDIQGLRIGIIPKDNSVSNLFYALVENHRIDTMESRQLTEESAFIFCFGILEEGKKS